MSIATIDRAVFLSALATLNRIVEKRNAIPILAFVVIKGDRRGITVRGTDMDLDCTVRLEGAKAASPFELTVSCYNLYDMMRKAKSDDVVIDEYSDDRIRFRFGTLNVSLESLLASDFPKFTPGLVKHAFEIDAVDLLEGLNRCVSSISFEETRYYLNGIYWHFVGKVMVMVATDGHRLAVQDMKYPAPAGSHEMPAMIVPHKTVKELIRACEAKDAPDKVGVKLLGPDESTQVHRIIFNLGPVQYETKLIDGSFPDYQRVIPTGNTKTLVLDREAAIDTIKAVTSISSERGRAVKMSLNGRTTFTVTNPDVGSASQTIDGKLVDSTVGPDKNEVLDIGFNSHYLLSILSELESDQVQFKLADPGSPAMITGIGGDHRALHVLMPMRV